MTPPRPSVIVTGTGGGIGTAIATAFHDAGWQVVAHHLTAPAPEGMALPIAADLTHEGAAERIVRAAVDGCGRLDAVVCNAAVQDLSAFAAPGDAHWRRMLDVNVLAAHRLTRAAAARMKPGSSITHIASIEGTTPAPDHAAYAVSKAALVMHAKAAALELGPRGIRVNSVSPGLVDRPGLAAEWPDGVGRYRRAAPLGRLVRPEEVASACLFLAGSTASGITGVDLVVDAGVSVHPHW